MAHNQLQPGPFVQINNLAKKDVDNLASSFATKLNILQPPSKTTSLYILGGITNEKFDYLLQSGWKRIPNCKRSYSTTAMIKNQLYVIGGRDANNTSLDTVLTLSRNEWVTLPLPLLYPRSESAAGTINTAIYVIGGYDHISRLVEVYDPVKNIHKELPKLQQGRWGHGVGIIEDNDKNNTIYTFGGHRFKTYLTHTEKFTPGRTVRWTSCTSMYRRRAYFATAVLPPYIYVFGGFGGVTNSTSIDRLASAERYDTRSDSWEQIKDMPSARSNIAAAIWGKLILIIGGLDQNKSKLKEILIYDPEKNYYSRFPHELPSWRFAHSSVST